MSGGTIVPRNECPGGYFFHGDSNASDTGIEICSNGGQVYTSNFVLICGLRAPIFGLGN